MTIISILIAFALCYFIRDLGRLHRFEWMKPATAWCQARCNGWPGWSGITGFLFYLGVPLVLLGLLNYVLVGSLGMLGGFLLSLAVLIYTLGPHDLDTDINAIIHADDDERQREALGELLGEDAQLDDAACQEKAVEFVFREALQRWFGTIFWFALLGVYGALLYRMADRLNEGGLPIEEEQALLFDRLRQVLDWPVAQLMTLALAIATDFDSVFSAWKKYHGEQQDDRSLFENSSEFLLASAKQIVLSGQAARDGYADQLGGPLRSLKQAMDLVWRIFGVWLTVLAILLLVDVMA
jgi:AmpE protein